MEDSEANIISALHACLLYIMLMMCYIAASIKLNFMSFDGNRGCLQSKVTPVWETISEMIGICRNDEL